VTAESQLAARLGDVAVCNTAPDMLMQGAATVLVGGLPWCGMLQGTLHGGRIVMGAATVVLGGPVFALPPTFFMLGSQSFKNKLVRDLFMLSTTRSGKEILDRLAASEQGVFFEPTLVPDNSFCIAADERSARRGLPTGSTIQYNPDVALWEIGEVGQQIDVPPQVVLGHELVHALNNAEGKRHFGSDPLPPRSEPDLNEEEAATIGAGSHSADYPTENSLRADLHLERRDNHSGSIAPGPTGDLRPGGYP
jgi:hypothetical protein